MKLTADEKKKKAKAAAKKKTAELAKKAKKNKTTSKDLPGSGQLKKVGKKLEDRRKMLMDI